MANYEAYSWEEGHIYLWTGTATASALAAYAQAHRLGIQYGREIHESIDGVYSEHQTGQRADLAVSAFYTYDATIYRVIQSTQVLNIQIDHNGVNGSAGWIFYSGSVDMFNQGGTEASPYIWSINYHSFTFTAYGG